MAIRGGKPTPTALKKLRGNPGRRPLNALEPLPPVSIPHPPESLGDIAREEWSRVTPILLKLHMVTDLDLAMLAAYCHSFQQWVESSKKVAELGYVFQGKNGGPAVNPYVWINSTAQKAMISAANELGLSPVSRSRMKVEKPKEESDAKKYLDRK